MDEREVELIDYLRVLWRQKWVIAVMTAAAIVGAWGASRAVTPTYRTETSLLLLPPLSSQLDAEAVGSRLAPEAYEELAVSTSLLQIVLDETGLSKSLSISELRTRFTVSVKRLSSEGELLLSAAVRGSDPGHLPVIARTWTQAFSDTYGELFQDRIARSYEYVSRNFEETEVELGRLVEQRTALLLEHPVAILEGDLAYLQAEETANRTRLADARLEYDTRAVELAALEEELLEQPTAFSLSQAVAPDSLVGLLGAGLSSREIEALAGIEMDAEQLNETYVSLNTRIVTLRASLDALDEEIQIRQAASSTLRDDLEATQRELTETRAKQDEMDREVQLLQAAYSRLAEDLQDAKLALAETPEPIRVIDEPLVPGFPIAPRKATNIAVAGFLGLIVGTLFAFFVDYLARVRKQEKEAQEPSERSLGESRCQQTDRDAEPAGDDHRSDTPPSRSHGADVTP